MKTYDSLSAARVAATNFALPTPSNDERAAASMTRFVEMSWIREDLLHPDRDCIRRSPNRHG
jgi:hypothetical protein